MLLITKSKGRVLPRLALIRLSSCLMWLWDNGVRDREGHLLRLIFRQLHCSLRHSSIPCGLPVDNREYEKYFKEVFSDLAKAFFVWK